MKFLRFRVLALTLFLVLQANAQKPSICKVGELDFACPERIEVLTDDKAKDLFVGFNSKDNVYVYAFSPDKELSRDALINSALEKAFLKIFLTKYGDYKIKDSNDFWGKSNWSRYETDKFAKVGFGSESDHFIHFQYVLLSFKKRQIVAGFLYEGKSRSNPKRAFDEWRGGGNGGASSNLQNLITSITGEKRTEVTPGGPPPPAPPGKNQ